MSQLADFPKAQSLETGMRVLFAEEEAKAISARTKHALAAAKARGTKLGNKDGGKALLAYKAVHGNKSGCIGARKRAKEFADLVRPVFEPLIEARMSDSAIAKALNADAVPTRREGGCWHETSVRRIRERLAISSPDPANITYEKARRSSRRAFSFVCHADYERCWRPIARRIPYHAEFFRRSRVPFSPPVAAFARAAPAYRDSVKSRWSFSFRSQPDRSALSAPSSFLFPGNGVDHSGCLGASFKSLFIAVLVGDYCLSHDLPIFDDRAVFILISSYAVQEAGLLGMGFNGFLAHRLSSCI